MWNKKKSKFKGVAALKEEDMTGLIVGINAPERSCLKVG